MKPSKILKTASDVLKVFRLVHGEMSGGCTAEVVTDDELEYVGVACMKDGQECWRATLTELAVDFVAMKVKGELK